MFRDMDAEYCNVDIPIIVKDVFLRICPHDLFWGLNLLLLYDNDDDTLEYFMATYPTFAFSYFVFRSKLEL
jgi:hypothetical protein